MRGSLRVNVSERVAQVILVHRRGRDLLGQDLVENRRVTGITRLGRLERLVHDGAARDDFAPAFRSFSWSVGLIRVNVFVGGWLRPEAFKN